MINVNTILTPIDFSASSKHTCLYAIKLAGVFHAEVVFLHVIPVFSLSAKLFFPDISRPNEESEVTSEERKKALDQMDLFLQSLPVDGVKHARRVEKGVPFVKIIQAIETVHPDLVIQGTHGTTGLESVIMGGTAWRIIRKTKCPVISIKPVEYKSFINRFEAVNLWGVEDNMTEMIKSPRPFPPQKILYPTDFSEASQLALVYAIALANAFKAELVILHAVHERESMLNSNRHSGGGVNETAGPDELMSDLHRQVTVLSKNAQIIPLISKLPPIPAIFRTTIKENIDLIVMGTQGRTGIGDLVVGSTADRIINDSPCPVMTVRPNWKLEEVEKRFKRIYRRLDPTDFRRSSSNSYDLTEQDLSFGLTTFKKSDLLLNNYSVDGLKLVFEEYGIFDILRREGFDNFRLIFNLDDPYRQLVKVFFGGMEDPEHLLIEMILTEGLLKHPCSNPPGPGDKTTGFNMLMLEWVCLQNPEYNFTPQRPPLPGQDYPGLGIGHEIYMVLILMAKRIGKEAVVNCPQFYHNAWMYRERFKFLNPADEGQLLALIRDTSDYTLADVSWAIYLGCCTEANTGNIFTWRGGHQILPFAEELKTYFASRRYKNLVWDAVEKSNYHIDWRLFQEKAVSQLKAQKEFLT
ncbi:MAG: universal stress protein [Deltaproteobacteria bacterium]|nr:universal stress protein [Deltaproteobacteria bacterium]